jgi:hypothetical protein
MSNKFKDPIQQLLWNLLEEKVEVYGKSKIHTVLKEFLKKDKADRTPKIEHEDLSALEKEADSVFAKKIIKRDKVCVTCKTDKKLTCSHFFKRGRQLIRFDEQNCNCQCESCNSLHNDNKEPYTTWMRLTYGQEVIDDLEMKSRQLKSWTADEYRAIIAKYSISKTRL